MIINLINNITWNILSKFIGKFLVRNHLMEESGFPGIASAPNMSTWTLMAGRSRVSLWQVRICHWRIRPGGQSPSSQWQIGDMAFPIHADLTVASLRQVTSWPSQVQASPEPKSWHVPGQGFLGGRHVAGRRSPPDTWPCSWVEVCSKETPSVSTHFA